jgi:hypothetical protein
MVVPKITTCIVCDLVRQEVSNKYLIVGYYGIAPNVEVIIANFDLPVALCFFFVGGPAVGHFRADMQIIPENGPTIPGPWVEGEFEAGKLVSNFFMGFQDKVPGPGLYNAEFLLNGTVAYRAGFRLSSVPKPIAPFLERIN